MGSRVALAIVPARIGSKTIPRKNLEELGGRPLVAWSIESARRSARVTRTVISTDDAQLAQTARGLGAEAPFMRPAELARDETPMIEVLRHALEELQRSEAYQPDVVVLLQPTAPFRRSQDIDAAVDMCFAQGGRSVVSVSPVPSHFSPAWLLRRNEQGELALLDGSSLANLPSRRQLLAQTYWRNGEIYVVAASTILEGNRLYTEPTLGLVTPGLVNIDTREDLERARSLLERSSR